MAVKYEALHGWHFSTPTIKEVEIERETDKSVWIDGHRYSKLTCDIQYFDTIDDARDWIVACADERVEDAKKNVEEAISHLERMEKRAEFARGIGVTSKK